MRQSYVKRERVNIPTKRKFFAQYSLEFNEETKSAMREAKLISEGKIPSKAFNSVDELLEDLMSDADD